jgi:hypothetical protein
MRKGKECTPSIHPLALRDHTRRDGDDPDPFVHGLTATRVWRDRRHLSVVRKRAEILGMRLPKAFELTLTENRCQAAAETGARDGPGPFETLAALLAEYHRRVRRVRALGHAIMREERSEPGRAPRPCMTVLPWRRQAGAAFAAQRRRRLRLCDFTITVMRRHRFPRLRRASIRE